MKVSLSWLGIFLITAALTYFIVYGYNVYESFQNHKDFREGFVVEDYSDLQVTRCPAGSESFINDKGITLCCEGGVENGKCGGTTFCSLSEPVHSLPTCSQWTEAYLEEKGAKRCPSSLPKYFESVNKQVRGCTSGNRNKDGTDILDRNQPFCKLYNDKKDDESRVDSCTNIILLDKAYCPNHLGGGVSVRSLKSFQAFQNNPVLVQCRLENKISYPNACYTDETLARYFEHYIPGKGISIVNSFKEDPDRSDILCSSFYDRIHQGGISLRDPPPEKLADMSKAERTKTLKKKYEKICKTL